MPLEPRLVKDLPSVARRLLVLGLRYLISASKEHQAARTLLVRLCMRPDMERLGVKGYCIDWASRFLDGPESGGGSGSIYSLIGVLSFLAGFLNSCVNGSATSFLVHVLEYTQDLVTSNNSYAKLAYGSATVRKLVIKIYRASAIHLLSGCSLPAESKDDELTLLGNIIDHLMTCLSDKDNPVRFSASKALSIIAQKLDPDMAEQLLDGLAERLQEDVNLSVTDSILAPLRLDYSTADPLRWQGLILTLSHLLFRHSAPKWKLTTILDLLVNALDFEQRSSTGASIGSGVRDAACFGMWSVARRYTTKELSQVAVSDLRSRTHPGTHTSVFRLLASELVLTATLDPEGNVRRAASAALQELVGRHPHKVAHGIDLVQIVDYQAVGLRSRGMTTVAVRAANLDVLYLSVVCDGLLSWRAINSPDATIRRRTAGVIGELFRRHGPAPLAPLQQLIESPKVRSLEEWHGLYLAFAAVFPQSPSVFADSRLLHFHGPTASRIHLLRKDGPLSDKDISIAGKKGHLAAEALCMVVSALAEASTKPVSTTSTPPPPSTSAQSQLHKPFSEYSLPTPSHKTATSTVYNTDLKTLQYHLAVIEASFEQAAMLGSEAYRDASVCVFNQLDDQGQKSLLEDWSNRVIGASTRHNPEAGAARLGAIGAIIQDGFEKSHTKAHESKRPGTLVSRTSVSCTVPPTPRSSRALHETGLMYDALMSQLGEESHWLARIAALKWLYAPIYLIRLRDGFDVQPLDQALLDCLEDRTTFNSRGVGSEVRTQAIETVEAIYETAKWDSTQRVEVFGRVYGLAVEKLDKVRDTAWRCIRKYPDAVVPKTHHCVSIMDIVPERMAAMSTSNTLYFDFMLAFCNNHLLRGHLIQGLITSASSGSEGLLSAARLAICRFISTGSAADVEAYYDSLISIIRAAMPNGRLVRPGLDVLAFMLDVDYVPCFPHSTQWKSLLGTMALLHRGSDLRTFETIIQVYTGLARYEDLRTDSLAALQRLLAHRRFPTVRLAAAAALFIIQPHDGLRTIDLSTPLSVTARNQVQKAYGYNAQTS
ncbi:MAG: hypothetical protein Q9208_003312 [Pyrenodesmia sp. 3 TL-2023]